MQTTGAPAPSTIADRSDASTERNRLLRALPANSFAAIETASELVPAERGTTLVTRDRVPDFVYFPQDCVASIVGATIGGVVEVATVGCEGIVGLSIVLGGDPMPTRTFIQVPGTMRRVPAAAFRTILDKDVTTERLMLRYVHAFLSQLAQSVACNRLHSLEERCARWLLMTHDRVGRDEFALTHEFLAEMLGVRRPSVSIAAKSLQDAGCIRYRRGWIEILDRRTLEQTACECYGIVRREYNRLPGTR